MHNTFLTGPINIGKSTIIRRAVMELSSLDIPTGGFYTLPYVTGGKVTGFYIQPLINMNSLPPPEDRMIARKIGSEWTADTAAFESIGAEILDSSLKSAADLVVMDELGFFEAGAFGFQDRVISLLSSPKMVLGVMKSADVPFLNGIRKREDVGLIEVTGENRDILAERILKKIRRIKM